MERPRSEGTYAPSLPSGGDCTTHFGVVEKERNLVSCILSAVGQFGSKVVTPGLGVLWNNDMLRFNRKSGSANSIAPWKRPVINMAPTIALKDGKPVPEYKAPGGRRIIGMGIQNAVTQPRVGASTMNTLMDGRLGEELGGFLTDMGHAMSVLDKSRAETTFATRSISW